MVRKTAPLLLLLCLVLVPRAMVAAPQFAPGASGVGDPYFPLAGNGGYDVQHYLLDLAYNPDNDVLAGATTITAKAIQNLSRFNLDFEGLRIESITVNGAAATWTREGGELIVRPSSGLPRGGRFAVVVRYGGVPRTIEDQLGTSGFIRTEDGAVVAGQPRVAATWFPVNDHPIDKAAYTIRWTVPRDLQAISNGVLESRQTNGAWATWTWQAREPMASYLVTAAIGDYAVQYAHTGGIRYWDAIDARLLEPTAAPRTGMRFAISRAGDEIYKRLARTVSVPASGATLQFSIDRDTEENFDFVFVEAHTVGQDDWTTLPDTNGHTTQNTGLACPFWLEIHPFLAHYQTPEGDGCVPSGTTGEWWAASGTSDGWEEWLIDLGAWASTDVEVAITYASDDLVQLTGVFVDDIVVSTGAGTTSFEADGNALDGWTVPGPPTGSPPNPNDWIVGTVADAPPPLGETVKDSFARQPEIIAFLSDVFSPYPFVAGGGIVDNTDDLAFALETQTRPIYSKGFFGSELGGDSVVVHELAHQWAGDSLALARWRDIWLNEGFATYAEWLWSEREGNGTTQEIFDLYYTFIPPTSQFWTVKVGDPGPDALFDSAIYNRGAMTLHQLRLAVGDADFDRILETWTTTRAGGNVTTAQFIRLAEQVSGEDLDALFATWLYSTEKPVLDTVSAPTQLRQRSPTVRMLEKELRGSQLRK